MERLIFSVRKYFHEENGLLKSCLDMDLSLFTPSSHINTDVAFIKCI